MDKNVFNYLLDEYPGYLMLGLFIIVIGAVGGAKLFSKADRRWYAAFVPIWNVIEVLKIVGRPISHIAYFLVPVYNIYFFFKLCIEIAQSFGKYTTLDYLLVCFFNVFYILNLALAYNEDYVGPVFGKDIKALQETNPAMV
jgi:hypothetical protein